METLVERATRLGVEAHTVSEMLDVIENTRGAMGDLAMLVARLARKLRKAAPADELPAQALDYLNRNGLKGSQLRKVGTGRTATVTKEMIGAAHDVMLAKGDFVLSARLLECIYLAMEQAAPPGNLESIFFKNI